MIHARGSRTFATGERERGRERERELRRANLAELEAKFGFSNEGEESLSPASIELSGPRTFPSRRRLSATKTTRIAHTHLGLTRRASAPVDEGRRRRAAARALCRRRRPRKVERRRSRASRRECSCKPPGADEHRRTAAVSFVERARRRHGEARERVDSARGARGQRRGSAVLHISRSFFGPARKAQLGSCGSDGEEKKGPSRK